MSDSSALWTYVRAITQFQSKPKLSRGGNRQKTSYSHADSFIHKYTTRNFGEMSEDSDCDIIESDLDESIDGTLDGGQGRDWRTYVVKPDGRFIHYWLFFVSLAVVYNLWFLVARDTWLRPDGCDMDVEGGKNKCSMTARWLGPDLICDIIFFLDILVQSRTGYLEHGILVTDRGRLVKRYIRTVHFACDIAALFPSMIVYLIIFRCQRCFYALLKFPRFLKVYRARHFLLKVESAASHPNGVRIFNLVHFLFLLTHLFAAVYYLVCRSEKLEQPNTWGFLNDSNSVSSQYLASFYWSTITLTTIGDIPRPVTNLEFVIQIFGFMLGIFVFATIVGQVGTVVENRNSTRLAFERHVDHAKRYMREHKVPSEVQKPIMRWYEYTWTRGQMSGRGDVNCLGLLPTKLRTELALHVNLKTLKKVSFFKRCRPAFLHDLVLKMQLNVITPGEVLCRKGEVARDVFIVSDGLLEVLGKRQRVIRRLETGDFFGEIGTMVSEDATNRRAVTVRSIGYSELFTISKEDIIRLLKDHPQAKKVLEDTARSYNFNRSRRRRSRKATTRRHIEKQKPDQEFTEENETNNDAAETNNCVNPPEEAPTTPSPVAEPDHPPHHADKDHLTVPTLRVRPARSVKDKGGPSNRVSLKYIPEGTAGKRRSYYRQLSETSPESRGVVRKKSELSGAARGAAKRVTFRMKKGGDKNRNSVVEIPDDVASAVEHKMDQLGENFKSLLAYTRELEEKVQSLKAERESLQAELMTKGTHTVEVEDERESDDDDDESEDTAV